jgi:D-glycero-D-manno-heptose 1,7-bisphosphate phosphatase
MANKAVFLDRDGTINSDEGHYYIYRKEDFVFNPGVIEGMKRLSDAGYLLFVVTNQGGVAKGLYTEADVETVNGYMCNTLWEHGIEIRKVYYCPHHDSVAPCTCRKPQPGMLIKAIEEFNISPEDSFMIGDSCRDIEAAFAAGVTGLKIKKNTDIGWAVDKILEKYD